VEIVIFITHRIMKTFGGGD